MTLVSGHPVRARTDKSSIVEKGRLLGLGCRNVVTKYHFQFDPLVPFVVPPDCVYRVSNLQLKSLLPFPHFRSRPTRSNQKNPLRNKQQKRKEKKEEKRTKVAKKKGQTPWKKAVLYLPLFPNRNKLLQTEFRSELQFRKIGGFATKNNFWLLAIFTLTPESFQSLWDSWPSKDHWNCQRTPGYRAVCWQSRRVR